MEEKAKYAQMVGRATYVGSTCARCGNNLRHTGSYECTTCFPTDTGRREKNGNGWARSRNAELRREAQARGDKEYDRITPCPQCADRGDHFSVRRYASTGSCVACQRHKSAEKYAHSQMANPAERKSNALRWREAKARGDRYYHRVTPCPKCAEEGDPCSTLRYTSNGGCAKCQVRRRAESYANRPGVATSHLLPIEPMFGPCGHGKELVTILPELQGKTLFYVNHSAYTVPGIPSRFGTCICCLPDRAIWILNKMREDGVPEEYARVFNWLARLDSVSPEHPHGFLQELMRRKNMAKHTGEYVPPAVMDVKLPPPVVKSAMSQEEKDELQRQTREMFAKSPAQVTKDLQAGAVMPVYLPLPGDGE